jgi:hypothetical protein
MLLSATGLTISRHYCNDQLIDVGLITLADNCLETEACENSCLHDKEMEKPDHCEDDTIKFETAGDYFVSSFSFDFNNVPSIDLFFTFQILSEDHSTPNSSTGKVLSYKKPPIPNEVVLSQIQSFII